MRYFLSFIFFISFHYLMGQISISESFAIINMGSGNVFYDLGASTGNPDFSGANFGTFHSNNTLILQGGRNRTLKCPPNEVMNGSVYYRIYPTGTAPSNPFLPLVLNFIVGSNTPSPINSSCTNQTWELNNAGINLLSGLCDGNYTLEMYTTSDYNTGTGTPVNTTTSNNGGSNYKATFSVNSSVLSGIFESYIILNYGGGNSFFNLHGASSSYLPNFQGANLGTFCQSASLVISGGENKTTKCPPNNVVNGKLLYRIYSGTSASGSFTEINLPFIENLPGAICAVGQNQRWQSFTNNINILTGLTPGVYTIEVYTQADYNSNDICPGRHYSNNGGANYKANFTVTGPILTQPSNQTLTNNSIYPGTIFEVNPSGTTIDWTNTNTSIGLPASGTGNINSFTVINIGNAPSLATIIATPKNGNCIGDSKSFTITILPISTSVTNAGVRSRVLKVYPNPASNVLQINYCTSTASKGELRLLDIQGRVVYSRAVSIIAGENFYDINLGNANISNGSYILKLNSGDIEQQMKIVVVN